MADYDINYADIRSDMTHDGTIITVEVTRDGTYLGQTAGLVAAVDYRRKYKEGRRLTLFFDGAARHLAELVAEDIRAGRFRDSWQLEVPMVPLDAQRANELAAFDSMHAALVEGDLLESVSTTP
jgi:hypothetical protein